MKKIYPLILLPLILNLNSLKAQSYMAAANRMVSQQMMNMSMTQMMNMNMNNMFKYANNQKYKFKVVMKDSSVLEVKSKIYVDTALHKSYLIYDDKSIQGDKKERQKKIYSTNTRNISRTEAGENYVGIATDSCWLFKVMSGPINAYSPLSETFNLKSFYLRAFQVGDGPIQKLDSAGLAPIVMKSPKALKAFQKKDYYKAIDKYNNDPNNITQK